MAIVRCCGCGGRNLVSEVFNEGDFVDFECVHCKSKNVVSMVRFLAEEYGWTVEKVLEK